MNSPKEISSLCAFINVALVEGSGFKLSGLLAEGLVELELDHKTDKVPANKYFKSVNVLEFKVWESPPDVRH
jgi:hypothetical protein